MKDGEDFRLALKDFFSSGKWFVAYVHKNKRGVSRLGIIVSKRVEPYSVNRNYVKRLIREGFRKDIPVQCALDIVIRLRQPLRQKTSYEGRKALAELLGHVKAKCASY